MSTTMELKVTGMTCGGCESSVQNAVGRVTGVQSVKADHQSGTVQVVPADAVDVSQIREAIVAAGFEVVSA